MKRLPDWEDRLTAVLAKSFERRFEYGAFDCCLFACECIEATTGEDLSLGLRGSYADTVSAALAIRRAGAGDVEMLAASMAVRHGLPEIAPAVARQGDIVLSGWDGVMALGVCVGEDALLATQPGLTAIPMHEWLRAWRIG